MISLPFRRQTQDPISARLYGTIVAQARSPSFYRDYGVPDTVAGRLDMIVLHLVLALRQLKRGPEAAQSIGQEHETHRVAVDDEQDRPRPRAAGTVTHGRPPARSRADARPLPWSGISLGPRRLHHPSSERATAL